MSMKFNEVRKMGRRHGLLRANLEIWRKGEKAASFVKRLVLSIQADVEAYGRPALARAYLAAFKSGAIREARFIRPFRLAR